MAKVSSGNHEQLRERLAKRLVQSDAPVKSLGKVMQEVGFTPTEAKTPSKVLESKSFQSLLDKYLPQDKVLNRHGQLVESDNEAVALGAVKLAHQVRGNFNEGTQVNNFVVQFENAPQEYETSDGEVIDINDKSELKA